MSNRQSSAQSIINKTTKILFCGSLKFLDEMKKVAKRLENAGFKCFLPQFALGDLPAQEIEKLKQNRKKNGLKDGEFKQVVKVISWFYDRLKEADVLVIFDKNRYVGPSLAAEIGAAHILGKPTLFLEEPEDAGIRALLQFSPNFKIVSTENITNELKRLKDKK